MAKATKKQQIPSYPHATRNISIGIVMIIAMLLIGMSGYHFFERLPWIDAFVNAAMILSGMGPVSTMITPGGKIFAGCYALVSGLAFIVLVAIIFSPVIHTFIRRIHLDSDTD